MAKILQSPIILPPETISKNTITRQAFSLGRTFAVTFQISSSNLKLIATESTDENGEIIVKYTSEPDTNKELGFSIFLTDDADAYTFGASAGRCGWIDYSTKGEVAEGINDSGNKVIVDFDDETGNINTNLDLLLDHVYPENINNLVKNQTPGLKSIFSMLFLSNKTFFNAVTDAYSNLYYDSLIVDVNGNVTDFLTGELKPISEYQAPVVIQYSIGENIHYMVYDFIFEDNPIDILNINYYTFRLLFENHGGILTLEIMKPGETFYRPCMAKELPYNYCGNHNIRFGFGQFTPLFSYDIAKKANFNIHNIQLQQSDERPDWLKTLDKELKNLLDMKTFNTELLGAENKLVLSVDLNIGEKLEAVKTLLEKIVPANITVELCWIDGLPMSYTRLEYIQTIIGQRAYIDTGYKVGNDVFLECDVCASNFDDYNVNFAFVATRPPDSPENWRNFGYLASGMRGLKPPSFYWTPMGAFALTNISNEWGLMTHLKLQDRKLYYNGVLKKTFNDIEWESYSTLFLGNNASIGSHRSCRYGVFRFGRGDKLLRNFIPALSPSGVSGMFDTVSKTFKTNDGTGQFAAGLSLQQVRDMNLPVPGDVNILYLSIPCEVYTDSEAWMAIEAAQQKGWTFTFYWTNVVDYITPKINAIVGVGNCTISYNYTTQKLSLSFAVSVTDEQISEVKSLLELELPKNIVTELCWVGGLPLRYKPLTYLKGGNKQYIGTGIYPDVNIGCSIETEPPSQRIMFPQLAGAASDNSSFVPLLCYSNKTIGFADNNSSNYPQKDGSTVSSGTTAISNGYQASGRIKVDFNYMNSGTWNYEDDKNNVSRGVELASFGLEIYLFARNYKNVNIDNYYFYDWDAPIYSARFSEDDRLIADFVPALDLDNGQPGMYDKVNKVLKTNSGVGDFSYPGAEQAVQTLDLDWDAKSYAKLTEHGVCRLYHVPKGYTGTMDDYAAANGFKELVEPPMPMTGYWIPQWHETETQLILDWIEVEPPIEEEITNN